MNSRDIKPLITATHREEFESILKEASADFRRLSFLKHALLTLAGFLLFSYRDPIVGYLVGVNVADLGPEKTALSSIITILDWSLIVLWVVLVLNVLRLLYSSLTNEHLFELDPQWTFHKKTRRKLQSLLSTISSENNVEIKIDRKEPRLHNALIVIVVLLLLTSMMMFLFKPGQPAAYMSTLAIIVWWFSMTIREDRKSVVSLARV